MRPRTRLLLVMLGITFIAFTLTTQRQRLVYNASDSAPRGWYWVRSATVLRLGDLVIAELPPAIAAFADQRQYLPRTVPILKHIGALAGQRVCIAQRVVSIDGEPLGRALAYDSERRPLPVWAQCRRLSDDEIFLFAVQPAGAFDSRYFGPITRSAVRGIATPLWTWTMP